MKPIKLDGVDATITDIYLGISAGLEEGNVNRYELDKMPQNKLSALGTTMFATVMFGENFPVGQGLLLELRYDSVEKMEEIGVDRTPQKRGELFTFKPPYFSQSIKKIGEHVLTIRVLRKYKIAGFITRIEEVGVTFVPYGIVNPV